MATSLAMIVLLGLIMNKIFQKMKLPGLLGMLLLGVAIGPYGLNYLDPSILHISKDLRLIALIVILLRAGLGLKKEALKKVGKTAIKFSFIPGLIEGFTIAFVSIRLLGFTFIEGGMLGFIIAAVSPAVIVPFMLEMKEKGLGVAKGIPTIILAGASIDDVFAITLFTSFLGLYTGSTINIGVKILNIPLSIILGILIGFILGLILVRLFQKYHMRDTKKVLIILGIALLLTSVKDVLQGHLVFAELIAVMVIGFMILEKHNKLAIRLSAKFNKIWVFAEILLFVLVGAEVNVSVAFEAGLKGMLIIAIGLIGRSIGVLVSLMGSDLNRKERLFCVFAYIPKATVQAAIASVPLDAHVASGEVILAIAVLSILITAPIGSTLISLSADKLLVQECES
ncbi:cation:proton antiporter [Vallitalea pronyensis]|uniref:Cation:proton antiporter n=1 Tax=Vallitalea pronyensis TaxID=1348613 RepID=A0A8J8SFG6_9FIRM|nr:cation:proton antiporter [Vallitalea pronyensis]QUI21640.1 cation:proton antiporter [Vallitalea pronyensis]